jgi:hypothetical protein
VPGMTGTDFPPWTSRVRSASPALCFQISCLVWEGSGPKRISRKTVGGLHEHNPTLNLGTSQEFLNYLAVLSLPKCLGFRG